MTENAGAKNGIKKADPYIGILLDGSYQIISLLGQGATTSVYSARDIKRDRLAAIKILHFQFASNEGTVQRFKQEIQTIQRLNRVNIVQYFDSGVIPTGEHYFVMELADGSSLKQLIKDGALDCKRTLRLFRQICAALIVAHQKGVVHRDIKPANIVVTTDENNADLVKLLDFGVAKLLVQGETFQTRTQTGEMLGTLLYMSPEQCLDHDLDGRSDIYSLGCVLFECLTGTPPFSARTAFETMNLQLTAMPNKLRQLRPDLSFPAHLDAVIQKALAKDVKHRYQTVAAFAEDLEKNESNASVHVLTSTSVKRSAASKQKSTVNVQESKYTRALQIWSGVSCGCGLLLCFVRPLFGVILVSVSMTVYLTLLYIVIKRKDLKDTLKSAPTLIRTRRNSDADFNIEEFANSVFMIVDTDEDGYISQLEMRNILRTNARQLSAHGKTFIQFVLDHYQEFTEIFKHIENRQGFSKAEILAFARSLPESAAD